MGHNPPSKVWPPLKVLAGVSLSRSLVAKVQGTYFEGGMSRTKLRAQESKLKTPPRLIKKKVQKTFFEGGTAQTNPRSIEKNPQEKRGPLDPRCPQK